MVHNPGFMAYRLSSHDQSLSKKPGLFSILKKLSIFHNTFLCTQNDLKQNFSKTQPVNGVEPWFSCLYFILTWQIILSKARVFHHQEIFQKFYIFHNSSQCTQNDLKQNFSKTQPVNCIQSLFLAYSWSSHDQSLSQKPGLFSIYKYFKNFLFSSILQ